MSMDNCVEYSSHIQKDENEELVLSFGPVKVIRVFSKRIFSGMQTVEAGLERVGRKESRAVIGNSVLNYLEMEES